MVGVLLGTTPMMVSVAVLRYEGVTVTMPSAVIVSRSSGGRPPSRSNWAPQLHSQS